MKKNNLLVLMITSLLFFNLSSANADGTYALVDANGNVTNIIVCGSACAGGTWDGQKAVPQVAPGPNNENRGGFWFGPGTTTYDSNTGIFTAVNPTVVTNSLIEEEDGTTVTSSATVYGGQTTKFTYNDTIGSNIFIANGFVGYSENTKSTISVNKNNTTESINFDNRKTESQIQESVQNSGLALLSSKVQILISLLGGWVK